jgi:hypothetical protein
MSEDRFVKETEQAEEEAWQGGQDERAANLFDLRRIIGGLFVLYGVVLTIVGLTDGSAEIEKAGGVHINLIAGLGMLALGIIFLIWAFTRPLGKQLREEEAASEQSG